jgi:hypothetical protein
MYQPQHEYDFVDELSGEPVVESSKLLTTTTTTSPIAAAISTQPVTKSTTMTAPAPAARPITTTLPPIGLSAATVAPVVARAVLPAIAAAKTPAATAAGVQAARAVVPIVAAHTPTGAAPSPLMTGIARDIVEQAVARVSPKIDRIDARVAHAGVQTLATAEHATLAGETTFRAEVLRRLAEIAARLPNESTMRERVVRVIMDR